MRWSLVLLGVFLVSAPLHPGVYGARVRRDDGGASLFDKLFSAILGGSDDDGEMSTRTNTDDSGTSPTESTKPSTSVASHTLPTLTSSTSTSTTTRSTTTLPVVCSRPNDMLEANCTITDELGAFLDWDTGANNLVSKVFSATVINELLSMCQPGDWCLSNDYIRDFAHYMGNFFNSPICEQSLQDCIVDMLAMRAGCPDNLNLSVLGDSLSLLCAMRGVAEITPACFGHTIATLHVTMADEIRATSKVIDYGEKFCLGAYVGMTRSFMCTLDRCPDHDQIFIDYAPWQWFMGDAPAIKAICQLDSVCGEEELEHAVEEEEKEEEKEEETSPASSYYSPTSPENTGNEEEYIEEQQEEKEQEQHEQQEEHEEHEEQEEHEEDEINKVHDADKPIFLIQASDDSTRLLIGVITGALIGVLVLMLLVGTIVKRIRKRYHFSTKDGYSKLHNQEFD